MTTINTIIYAIPLAIFFNACGSKKSTTEETVTPPTEEITANMNKIETVTGDTITTASGLRYIKITTTENTKPTVGDLVSVHYRGTLLDGTMFDESYERGQPFSFTLGKGQVIKGWDEGIALLAKGEKARLLIPAALAYGSRGAGGVIPPNADLIFDVELIDFKEGYKPYKTDGIKPITTASGLKFWVIKEGDASKRPKPGQTAIAHYAGFLTNGTKFDASHDRGQPFEFPVGQGQVIKGWDEIIQLMGIGAKYKVQIPPSLGYGTEGAGGQIPGNATLIFDMELLGIK
jgi:peptidylprolyl isomerase